VTGLSPTACEQGVILSSYSKSCYTVF
jgi:hypothetical protein